MRETRLLAGLAASHLLIASGCAAGGAYTSPVREDCKPAASVPDGATPPREARPGCFGENLVIPPEVTLSELIRTREGGVRRAGPEDANLVVARWAVCSDGAVGTLHLPQYFGTRLAKEHLQVAVWRAVQSCEWRPGVDATGRPMDMWMSAPIEIRR
jgi:hypothetical protein